MTSTGQQGLAATGQPRRRDGHRRRAAGVPRRRQDRQGDDGEHHAHRQRHRARRNARRSHQDRCGRSAHHRDRHRADGSDDPDDRLSQRGRDAPSAGHDRGFPGRGTTGGGRARRWSDSLSRTSDPGADDRDDARRGNRLRRLPVQSLPRVRADGNDVRRCPGCRARNSSARWSPVRRARSPSPSSVSTSPTLGIFSDDRSGVDGHHRRWLLGGDHHAARADRARRTPGLDQAPQGHDRPILAAVRHPNRAQAQGSPRRQPRHSRGAGQLHPAGPLQLRRPQDAAGRHAEQPRLHGHGCPLPGRGHIAAVPHRPVADSRPAFPEVAGRSGADGPAGEPTARHQPGARHHPTDR